MQNSDNIKEIFQSSLADFSTAPSDGVWGAINNGLNGAAMETLFQEKLVSNTIVPSASTWGGIVSALPKVGFWIYSLKSINVFTVSAVALFLIATIYIISPFLNQREIFLGGQLYTNITENTIISSSSKSDRNSSYSENQKDKLSENEGGDKNNIFVGMDSENTDSNNNGELVVEDEGKPKKKENPDFKSAQLIKHKKNRFIADNSQKKSVISSIISIENEEGEKKTKQNQNSGINKNPIVNITESKQAISFVDTIIYYDTIQYYDTLLVKKIEKRNIKTKSLWSLSPHVSLFASNPKHKYANKDSQELSDIFNQSSLNETSSSFGLGVNFDYKKLRISTGIDYTVIREEFIYETQKLQINPIEKYTLSENGFYKNIIENISYVQKPVYEYEFVEVAISFVVHEEVYENYTVVDTVWKYRTDTLINKLSDSTEIVTYDTIRIATYDTAYYNSVDTNVLTAYYQNINKYTYIDLPFSISYAIKIRKLTLRPTLGAILGIMLNAKGNGIEVSDKNVVYNMQEKDLPFMNIQVSVLLALGIEYQIQDGLSVFAQPFYRRNLSSILNTKKSPYIDKRFNGLGVTMGISFYF